MMAGEFLGALFFGGLLLGAFSSLFSINRARRIAPGILTDPPDNAFPDDGQRNDGDNQDRPHDGAAAQEELNEGVGEQHRGKELED